MIGRILGINSDRAFARDLETLNHLDFRALLRPHMMDDGGLLNRSVLLRVVYDSSFGYRGGDTRVRVDGAPQADYEAGTLLAGLLRAAFTYKGAFGWKLRGGTGDALLAPIYALLRARGVEFLFFHRVDALVPSEDGRFIDRGATRTIQRELLAAYAPGLRGVHEALRGADTWLTNTLVRAWRARARQIAVRMSASPAGAAAWSRRLARESAALAAGLDALAWRLHERAAAGVESAAFATIGSGQ